ncbi:rod shape-determining protein MreD [Balneolaceae bacterium ANBcel3]|nr:rod shape-determining protein MreD [Balneolaceae bacterium ANBcel3]
MTRKEQLIYGILGLSGVLLQVLIFNHLSFGEIRPDLPLVLLIWVISTQKRTTALVFAAFTGLLFDFFMDLWGLHLMAKTATTWLVYRFTPRIEETKLVFSQVFLLIFAISFIHHLIFLLSSLFTQVYQAEHMFLEYLIGCSFLTAIIGSIIYILRDT